MSREFFRIEIVFRILDHSRWTWRDDVANHDPNLEIKCAQSLLTSHNWRCVAEVIMGRTGLALLRGAFLKYAVVVIMGWAGALDWSRVGPGGKTN